jgi:hypothetical protein
MPLHAGAEGAQSMQAALGVRRRRQACAMLNVVEAHMPGVHPSASQVPY